jgi:hypothetical protein
MCAVCQDCAGLLDGRSWCGDKEAGHDDTSIQVRIVNGIGNMSLSDEKDCPEHEVAKENILHKLLDAYDGGGSDFSLDLSVDDESKAPS